jgi:glycosyltransferase involved in cell wall biosynthesis
MHVITGLWSGGAETMLCKLVSATRSSPLRHSVVSLLDGGDLVPSLRGWGIPVHSVRMRLGTPDPRAIARLAGLLRRERPDVVQSWMYHADLLAGVAALVAGRPPVIWNIRHADNRAENTKRLTHLTRSVCARLSGVLPARIVCCAESARRSHAAIGYRSDRMLVVPNGFDLDRFAADRAAGARIRRELSIPDRTQVVGLLARFHPDKDHRTFITAAQLVSQVEAGAVFLLAGRGADWSNRELRGWIDDNGLRERIRLLGHRSDVPQLLSAMDVHASSSRTEAFPNVLGEAMACGVPCVVTDCGDSREILGPTGRVVPPRDPAALAGAILDLLRLDPGRRAALAAAAAERVRALYDLRAIARRYVDLYFDCARSKRRSSGRVDGWPVAGRDEPPAPCQ